MIYTILAILIPIAIVISIRDSMREWDDISESYEPIKQEILKEIKKSIDKQ